jgi:hypothetical protein
MDNELIALLSELRIWTQNSNAPTKILVLVTSFFFRTIWLLISAIYQLCQPLVEKGVELAKLVLEHALLNYLAYSLFLLLLLLILRIT